jgi:excisionase family DNA binding protein
MSNHLKWFSVGQASKFVGLQPSTIKRLIKTGQLRSCSIPGDIKQWRRIPREDLLMLQREMERNLRTGGAER